jgi:membrane fusion protein (multidrug efflux system)
MKNKIYLLSFLIIITSLLTSCGSKKSGGFRFPPTPVTAYTVKTGKASYYINYPATVVALNQIEIRPEVSGYLTAIDFKDGQHVTKGMKLYTIDQQQYQAAYNIAQANLNKAKQDYNRYKELAKSDAIAAQTLEHSLEDLKAAESNLNSVETNLRNSVITAPFSGTIGISQVKLGSAVSAGQTLMNTLSSDNPMAVDFNVDEKLIEHFTDLLNRKITKDDSTFSLILPDENIYAYHGRLILLDRAVDPQTGTITARLEFPNPRNILRPGLTCSVRILNNNTSKSVIIPYKAVTVEMGEYFVFVIHKNKVAQQRIEIGRTINDDMVIVESGLKPGEKIVTQGVQKLRNGSQIILASSQKTAGGVPKSHSGK